MDTTNIKVGDMVLINGNKKVYLRAVTRMTSTGKIVVKINDYITITFTTLEARLAAIHGTQIT